MDHRTRLLPHHTADRAYRGPGRAGTLAGRMLGLFWLTILLGGGGGAWWLHTLGPPRPTSDRLTITLGPPLSRPAAPVAPVAMPALARPDAIPTAEPAALAGPAPEGAVALEGEAPAASPPVPMSAVPTDPTGSTPAMAAADPGHSTPEPTPPVRAAANPAATGLPETGSPAPAAMAAPASVAPASVAPASVAPASVAPATAAPASAASATTPASPAPEAAPPARVAALAPPPEGTLAAAPAGAGPPASQAPGADATDAASIAPDPGAGTAARSDAIPAAAQPRTEAEAAPAAIAAAPPAAAITLPLPPGAAGPTVGAQGRPGAGAARSAGATRPAAAPPPASAPDTDAATPPWPMPPWLMEPAAPRSPVAAAFAAAQAQAPAQAAGRAASEAVAAAPSVLSPTALTPPTGAAPPAPPAAAPPAAAPPAAAPPARLAALPPAATPGAAARGTRPDLGLLEASPFGPLPRVAPDWREPWRVYAAAFPATDWRPRVSVMVAGLGLSATTTEAALQTLPPAMTLAFSPHAPQLTRHLSEARAHGHEVLIGVAMEPYDFPLNDPGPQALMTALPPEENLRRLSWVLSRAQGYVGVTNVTGLLRGERFIATPDQMKPVLDALRARGLMFVDARLVVGGSSALTRPPGMPLRAVDLVVDERTRRADIDARLAELEQIARQRGAAVGLAGPYPVTIERLAAWAAGLEARGLVLAPITAIAAGELARR